MLITAVSLTPLFNGAVRAEDSRAVYSRQSPDWLRAVGKLTVPGSRWESGRRQHYREDCTATLVDLPGARHNRWLLSAWHCLEFYNDLSKPILFTLSQPEKDKHTVNATVVDSGGGIHRDWALLRLATPVSVERAPPLPLGAAKGMDAKVTMAGFSSDAGLGQSGEVLTYDPHCTVTHKRGGDYQTNCTAFKGASGGPVVEHDAKGIALLTGVISRGDSDSVSIFVPTSRFSDRLRSQR